jgi:hypothetical protein
VVHEVGYLGGMMVIVCARRSGGGVVTWRGEEQRSAWRGCNGNLTRR